MTADHVGDVLVEVPEWLVPHFTTYAAILNQTVAAVVRDEQRRWLSPCSYINEERLVSILASVTGLNPRQAIEAMVSHGFVMRQFRRGLRLVPTDWHNDNVRTCTRYLLTKRALGGSTT